MKIIRRLWNFITICTIIIFSIILLGCGSDGNESSESDVRIPVSVVHPRMQTMTEYLTLNATTIFMHKATVRSTFQGYVEEAFKGVGDPVRIGDKLFRMQTKEAAASDSIQLSLGAGMFKRYVDFTAKINGIITEVNYYAGDYVSDGEQLAKIGQPGSLRIVLDVPFQNMKQIRKYLKCEVAIPGSGSYEANVDKIVPSVDPASQTQTVLLRMEGERTLPENLNLIVRFPVNRIAKATVLPKKCVLSNETQDRFWIMKLSNDSTAMSVGIEKGSETDSLVQILSPALTTADRVIIEGAYGLPDTVRIILQNAE
jgi:multidrug efflux pump subunit AcrA (membrane-fusion protein)